MNDALNYAFAKRDFAAVGLFTAGLAVGFVAGLADTFAAGFASAFFFSAEELTRAGGTLSIPVFAAGFIAGFATCTSVADAVASSFTRSPAGIRIHNEISVRGYLGESAKREPGMKVRKQSGSR
ncbi:hypothetical protein [Duganella sp. BuS-21]|uniref:hypothetical protein n=1 Tax=Duganella sp. BuS-21 TaxID=2943848 RepID=UPI0035A6FF59